MSSFTASESSGEAAGTAGDMQNSQMSRMKKMMMRMKIHNTLVRQCLGEIIGTFVLMVSLSSTVSICDKRRTPFSIIGRTITHNLISQTNKYICEKIIYVINMHKSLNFSVQIYEKKLYPIRYHLR